MSSKHPRSAAAAATTAASSSSSGVRDCLAPRTDPRQAFEDEFRERIYQSANKIKRPGLPPAIQQDAGELEDCSRQNFARYGGLLTPRIHTTRLHLWRHQRGAWD